MDRLLAASEPVDDVLLAVTGRLGGVSAAPYDLLNLGGRVGDGAAHVEENRRRLAAAVGVARDRLVLMDQVHSADVEIVTAAPMVAPRADAIVTDRRDLALVALGADCAPVVLADTAAGVIGAAHVGRRGLVVGVLAAAVRAMRELGARDILARVGPAICGRCYELPAGLVDEVGALVPGAVATTQWGTPGVDIGAGALEVLQGLGVAARRAGGCTYESRDLYSHRRDGVTGRHAALVVRR